MLIDDQFDKFVSIRITTSDREKIYKIFDKCPNICYGWEVGDETQKPHVHIAFVPGPSYKENTLRKIVADAFGKGNENYSFKKEGKNTLYKAMSYILKGDDIRVEGILKEHTHKIPQWVEPREKKKKEDDEDDFSKPSKSKNYLLGFNNLVKQALRYRARFLAQDNKSVDLEYVIAHMYAKSDWRLATTVLKQGIPKSYFLEFKAMIGHTMEKTFTPGYFAMMMRDDAPCQREFF